ncbi:GNAT family N-acetyltransferase [Candidatus Woesearchaeota archaeon]|jgi:diamine N-acetyltransferase|nr:GNAT family N-acetyltransferase [Candidatus Woesearchaeota archaeon]MBT6519187.1 GNAT family N-acetyltransferase [Candidatus Woesearchaeota archaeon]MBT7367655.1 GNAT family N-acetyltransferase [Candidatus Woesearchaeota archaeon]
MTELKLNIVIRTANPKDVNEIQILNSKLFESDSRFDQTFQMDWPMSKEGKKYFIKRITKDNGLAILAVDENSGKVAGYLIGAACNAQSHRKKMIVANLENMFVKEEFRSRGIGTKLYNEFLKWSQEKNANRIKVEASAKNDLAIKFYRRQGFEDYDLVLEKEI